MFFARINKLVHTLAFRLTLWYAAVFILSSGVAFALFYLLIVRIVDQRIDADLITHANRLDQIYALQGGVMMQRAAFLHVQAVGEKKIFFRLFYPSGVFFSSSNMSYWKNIFIDQKAVVGVLSEGRTYQLVTQHPPDVSYPVRVIYKRIGRNTVLQMGYAKESESNVLQSFKRNFLFTMAGLLVIAATVGWFTARRALAGVASVTRTARRISEDDLDTRVPIKHHHDEIDQLAMTFNQMLDRIRQLVTGIRQMNDNIAHDLRSPITRMRGLAEITLTGGEDLDEFRQMAASTIEECDRLLQMINTMLTIAHTEAGVDANTFESIDLATMAQDACTLFQPLAEDKGIRLQFSADDTCPVRGNTAMLQRVAANLVDNAIKYTPAAGHVWVSAQQRDRHCCLIVADNGPGIPVEDRQRIFQRFFRGDQSRIQGGSGLGLSLVQAIVKAHGGRIQLDSTPEKGTCFTVLLPADETLPHQQAGQAIH
ncbi:MAG: HAMP domain-containing protein [Desulfatitalea sp.]|nr:HAMP domain-containing histidine kinase [Desulfatitalea sp.]NNK01028.1 HAMP domain-containing protein [Desulfatitalea sp.]